MHRHNITMAAALALTAEAAWGCDMYPRRPLGPANHGVGKAKRAARKAQRQARRNNRKRK